MNFLVLGRAGFIGSHLADRLLAEEHRVTVLDYCDPFHAPEAKWKTLAAHLDHPRFQLVEADTCEALEEVLGGEANIDRLPEQPEMLRKAGRMRSASPGTARKRIS